MSKSKNRPQQPKGRSAVALDSKLNRPAGIHADQRKRGCPKALRRDRSYREAY